MNLREYKKNAFRTLATLPTKEDNINHMLFGMVTEIGELVDLFKRDLAYSTGISRSTIIEEIGDLMWYIQNLCSILNMDLENILNINISKLKERYPDKFTTESAVNRDLDKEAKVLEGNSQLSFLDNIPVLSGASGLSDHPSFEDFYEIKENEGNV